MRNQNNKQVDTFLFEQLTQIYSNQTQIWSVRHNILNKKYTCKKLKNKPSSAQNQALEVNLLPQLTNEYSKLLNQTTLLKRLRFPFAPRCYKIIKTRNHIYTIFEQFPSLSLKAYLQKQLQGEEASQTTAELSQGGTATPPKRGGDGRAEPRQRQPQPRPLVAVRRLDFGPYLRTQLKYSFAIYLTHQLIYCLLGQTRRQPHLFLRYLLPRTDLQIHHPATTLHPSSPRMNSKDTESAKIVGMLDGLISRMAASDPQQRPTIQQVASGLDGIFRQVLVTSDQTCILQKQSPPDIQIPNYGAKISFCVDNQLAENRSQPFLTPLKAVTNLTVCKNQLTRSKSYRLQAVENCEGGTAGGIDKRLLSSANMSTLQVPTPVFRKRSKTRINVSRSTDKNSCKQNRPRANTCGRLSRIKQTTHMRNLSFLLSDLSEFVFRTDLNPQLAFLLLKHSLLTLRSNYQLWKTQLSSMHQEAVLSQLDLFSSQRDMQFNQILRKEMRALGKMVSQWKQVLRGLDKSNVLFNAQLDQTNTINYKFLSYKIRQFTRQIIVLAEKGSLEKAVGMEMTEILFKTYLILKHIEEGSYERFWRAAGNPNQLYLHRQEYLIQQKGLGQRYIKSRIAEIMSSR